MILSDSMRCALYARVSSADQRLAPQLDALRAYAKARSFDVAVEYLDHGVSGATAQRPALDQLLDDAKRRRFDVLAVVKLDRLARSVRHLTALAAELEALGVDLVVLDQSIDTSVPAGRLLFNVLGAIAEFERDLIRERTRAGMAAARRRGKRVGRPRVHVPVSQARGLLAEGATVSSAARELGVSRATLQRALKRVAPRSPCPSNVHSPGSGVPRDSRSA